MQNQLIIPRIWIDQPVICNLANTFFQGCKIAVVHAPNRMLNWLPKTRLIVWYFGFHRHGLSYLLEVFEKIMRFKWLPHGNCLLIIVKNHYLLNKSIRKIIILFLVFFDTRKSICVSLQTLIDFVEALYHWMFPGRLNQRFAKRNCHILHRSRVAELSSLITVNRIVLLIRWVEVDYEGWLSSRNHIFESACQVDGKFEKFLRSQEPWGEVLRMMEKD